MDSDHTGNYPHADPDWPTGGKRFETLISNIIMGFSVRAGLGTGAQARDQVTRSRFDCLSTSNGKQISIGLLLGYVCTY